MTRLISVLLLALALCCAGCNGPALVTTPNLYRGSIAGPWADVAQDRRATHVEILYATDRARTVPDGPLLSYDHRRSPSLVLGRAVVSIGEANLSWEALVAASLSSTGTEVPMSVVAVEELVRFPAANATLVAGTSGPIEDPEIKRARQAARAGLSDLVAKRLDKEARKEAYVFIHGVANTFEDPLIRMAQLWHFVGREGVPIVYTWPSGMSGALRGYTYDRESSEFTTYHLREFLQALAASPSLQRIHIVAHSRGTDIIMSTLRDLQLLYRDRGLDARQELKLGNLVLAAPDLDWEIAQQRFVPDQVHMMPSRVTIYMSPDDKAIGISEWLFGSMVRIGRMGGDSLSEGQRAMLLAYTDQVDFIQVDSQSRSAYGHSYFVDDPAVLSDLLLMLREDRNAGPQNGRPLEHREDGFWAIHTGYPQVQTSAMTR